MVTCISTANIFVRIGRYNHPWIPLFLAAGGCDFVLLTRKGASGIIAPSVNSAAEVKYFLNTVRQYPSALAIVMIETKAAVQDLQVHKY